MKAHVAGIAMGLIKEDNKFAVLTDILGDEDHLGDMDFKVAGTTAGITALQMDIKIQGITKEIMQVALAQAKEARMHILGQDARSHGRGQDRNLQLRTQALHHEDQPREDPRRDRQGRCHHPCADRRDRLPRSTSRKTAPSPSPPPTAAKADEAKRRIEEITAEVEIGKVYEGPIVKILEFGALVNVLPGKDGLLHISQIAHERVEKVTDYLQEGQIVKVKALEADDKGRIKLSMKALLERPAGMPEREPREPRRVPRTCPAPAA